MAEASTQKKKKEKSFQLRRDIFNDVRDQIECGCCYAMAVTIVCEAHYHIRHGTKIQLSPQELADCIHDHIDRRQRLKPDDVGCKPSSVTHCYRYMMRYGVSLEDGYPYKGKKRGCKPPVKKTRFILKNYKTLDKKNEEKILSILHQFPIACVIEVFDDFYDLKDEVYQGPKPPNEGKEGEISTGYHSLVIVGFGVQHNIKYYWVRNSWGDDWGIKGYGKVARDQVLSFSSPGKMELLH